MNKYYILIPVGILILSIVIYLIIKIMNDLKHAKIGFQNYGKLGITNCANDKNDTCDSLLNMTNMTYDFTSTKEYNKNNIIYVIKLIANFLKYLNSNYNIIKLNINNLFNQKLIISEIDTKPIGISFSSQDKTKVFFVFRGTQTAADFFGDITYNYYDDNQKSDIKIHKFYYNLYQEIKPQLLKCLYKQTTDIYICGHSMGAAISFVMAQNISQNKKYKVNVIGIAPPRTGNKEFVNSLKANCKYMLAIINMADLVPSSPFTYMPNLIQPYTPVQFDQITPALVFNNLNVSINANHQLITYYEGINGSSLAYLS
jgi:hypothetical protein